MKKIYRNILIVLSVILFGICVFTYIRFLTDVGQKKEEMAQIQKQVDDLRAEKMKLEKKKYKVQESDDENDVELPGLLLCFRNTDQSAYTEVYPSLQDKDRSGVLVFLNNELPDYNGGLTPDQAKEMHDNSWGIVIGPGEGITFTEDMADNEEKLMEFMDGYKKEFKSTMGYNADGIYFVEDTYSLKFNDELKALGIKKVFYEGKFVKCSDDDLALVHVENDPGNEDIKTDYDKGQITGYRYDLVAGDKTLPENEYSKESLDDVLTWITDARKDKIFEGITYKQLGISRVDKERIEEIDQNIKDIYHGNY